MTRADAMAFLTKAEQYLAAAQDSFTAKRFTVAAGDAIHAGISAKDAIMTMRTGSTGRGKDHMQAARELRRGWANGRRRRLQSGRCASCSPRNRTSSMAWSCTQKPRRRHSFDGPKVSLNWLPQSSDEGNSGPI